MQIKGNTCFVVFMLLVSIFGIIHPFPFPYLEAKIVPLLASGVLFFFMAVELTKEFRGKGKAPLTIEKEEKTEPEEDRIKSELSKLTALIAWLGGFLLAIYLLGFVTAIALFVFSYLKGCRRGWLIAIVFAVSIAGLTYCIFVLTLKLRLPRGLIFSHI